MEMMIVETEPMKLKVAQVSSVIEISPTVHCFNFNLIQIDINALENKLLIFVGQCPLNHFRCFNQRCVPNNLVCNGNNDCGDYTDESEGCFGNI